MSSKRGEGGWLGSDARVGGDGNGGFADSVSQGVFVLRKAPALSKRPAARKSFVPLVSEEMRICKAGAKPTTTSRPCWRTRTAMRLKNSRRS